MSNDKVAATMGGSREDLPYRVQAYAIGHAHGKGHSVPTVQDWLCAQRWAKEEQQPTGEHVWDKVTEDTMAAYSEADAKATMRMYETLPGEPKRDWTPTKGELAICMGIVIFIIVIFCFIVVAY